MSQTEIEHQFGVQSVYQQYLVYRPPSGTQFSVTSKKYWLKIKDGSYKMAEVIDDEDPDVVVIMNPDTAEELILSKDEAHPVNPLKFDGVDDCAQLPHLSEASVLHNLSLRYDANIIYTYSGLFCVAINPYRLFPIYIPEIIKMYSGKRREELAPHVYAVADGAYRKLLTENKCQSMLVTGESGAGKTENTKKIIQYLAAIAGKSGQEGELERQLLQANPLLEALGNAKTLKNNNSSRFGKFIKITFSKNGKISGGSIVSYLLERSRVISQGRMERNFHIFYQLCEGLPEEKRKSLLVGQPEDYYYLSQSGCMQVEGLDDASEFSSTLDALKVLNFSEIEITTLLRIVSGILHIGNSKYDGEENARIVNMDPLNKAGELLGIKSDVLLNAIIKPKITIGSGEKIAKHLNPTKAAQSRDALSKALYGRMFLWVVDKINQTLKIKQDHLFIGILDIAGFEIFQNNSFEQLCINFTNERLQQFFNNHMFTLEQEEYRNEKIEWTFINFGIDLQATIDLISKPGRGLLAMLDEESLMPQGNDKDFAQKVSKVYTGKHPKYSENRLSSLTTFNIEHYAGLVTYNCDEWCEKNKDPLENDLEEAVKSSSNPILTKMFVDFSSNPTLKSRTQTTRKGVMLVTVGNQYREQLDALLTTLKTTTPHFIRCIIPNHRKVAGEIDDNIVLEQLACNGVLEGIKISRLGYPNRMIYKEFHKRYFMLGEVAPSVPDSKAASQTIIDKLVAKKLVHAENVQFGLTKIFFRVGELAAIEEDRERYVAKVILDVQACARGYLARKVYQKKMEKLAAIVKIQDYLRLYLQLKECPWFRSFMKVKASLQVYTWELEYETQRKKIDELQKEINKTIDEKTLLWEDAEDLEFDILKVKKDIDAKDEDCQDLEEEYDLLNSEIKNQREAIIATEDEIAKKNTELETLERSRDYLELEIMQVEKTGGDFTLIIDKLEKEIRELNEKAVPKKYELHQLIETNQDQAQENDRLQAELEPLLEDLEYKKSSIRSLEKTKWGLEDEVEDLKEMLSDVLQANSNFKHQISILSPQVSDLSAHLNATSRERTDTETQVKFNNAELDKLTIELELLNETRIELESKKRKYDLDLREIEEDTIDESKVLEEVIRKLKKNELDYQGISTDLSDIRDKIQQKEILKVRRQGEVDLLKKQLTEAESELQKLEKEKKGLLSEIDKLTSDIEDTDNLYTNLENKNNALLQNINQFNQKINQQDNENGKMNKYFGKLEDSVQTLWKNISAIRAASVDVSQKNKFLQTDLQEIKKQKDETTDLFQVESLTVARLQKLAIELENSKEKLLKGDEKTKDLNEKLMQELERLQKEKKGLTDKKDKLTSTVKRVTTSLNQLTPEHEIQSRARQQLESEIKSLTSQIKDLQEEKDKLDLSNNAEDRAVTKLTSEIDKLRNELDRVIPALEVALKKGNKLNSESQELKNRLPDLLRDLAAQQYQHTRVLESIDENRELITDKEKQIRSTSDNNRILDSKIKNLTEEIEFEKESKAKLEKRQRDLKLGITQISGMADEGKLKNLESKKSSLEGEASKMKSDLHKYVDETKKIHTNYVSVKRNLDSSLNNLNETVNSRTAGEKVCKKLVADIKSHAEKLRRQEEFNKQLERDCKDAEKEAAKAASQFTDKQDRSEELKDIREEIQFLRSQIEKDHSEYISLDKTQRKLADQLENLQKEKSDLHDSQKGISGNEVSILNKIKEARRQIKQNESRNTILKNEILSSETKLSGLKYFLREETEKTDQLRQQRDFMSEDLIHIKNSTIQENKKRVAFDQELRDLTEKIRKSKEPLPDFEAQQEDTRRKIKEIKKMRKLWFESDAVMENQQKLIDDLKTQIGTLTNNIKTLHHENKNAVLEIEELQKQCDDQSVETNAAVYSQKSFESILKDLQEELKETREQLKKEKNTSFQNKNQKDNESEETAELKRNAKKEGDIVKYLEENIKDLYKEKEEIEKLIYEEQESINNILHEKAKCRAAVLDAKLQLEEAQSKYAQLDQLYTSQDYQNLKLSYKIDPQKTYGVPREIKLEAKVKKYQTILESEEKRAEILTADLKRHKNELQRLKVEVAEQKDELSSIKKKIRLAKDPRRRLTDRLIAMNAANLKPKVKVK